MGCEISGAGFSSKSRYMFGKVTIQIKLVEGDSAGTVTAFYVSNNICAFLQKCAFLSCTAIFVL